jgi:hypothetical protein
VVSTKVQSALERLKEQQAPDTQLLEPEREGEGGGNSGANGAYATTSVKAAAAGGGGNSTDQTQRAAKEALLLRQKTLGMEMRQRARLGKMESAHHAQVERLTRTQEDEFSGLIREQADEVQEFTEVCTRLLTVGARWAPDPAIAAKQVVPAGTIMGDESRSVTLSPSSEENSDSGSVEESPNDQEEHSQSGKPSEVSPETFSTLDTKGATAVQESPNPPATIIYGQVHLNHLLDTLLPHRKSLNNSKPNDRSP